MPYLIFTAVARLIEMAKDKDLVSVFKSSGASPFRKCQWPFGEPGKEDFRFCGEATHESFSYCHEHVGMAYREVDPRRSHSRNSARNVA